MKEIPLTYETVRKYLISSADLKDKFGLEGEIKHIGLHEGRSPNEIKKGISPNMDLWFIETVENKL